MTPVDVANEIVAAVRVFSRHPIGTIIIVDPAVPIAGGTVTDAVLRREILVALAIPESLNQLHRGAVVVRAGRVERVGVPISWTDVVERAADLAAGVAIAVDEDTAEVRVSERKRRVTIVEGDNLRDLLRRHATRLHS